MTQQSNVPTEKNSNMYSLNSKISQNTLASLPASKFSDSETSLEQPTPTPSSISVHHIAVPDRLDNTITFAWAVADDHFGPGVNTPTQYTAPTPKDYPISIFIRKPNPSVLESKHRWNVSERIRRITWKKVWHTITGTAPVSPCYYQGHFYACGTCRERQNFLWVGKEVEIGGHWGSGKITSIIGHESNHLVVEITGKGILTATNTALARIPVEAFFLTRKDKLRRRFLMWRGKVPPSPNAVMVVPRKARRALDRDEEEIEPRSTVVAAPALRL